MRKRRLTAIFLAILVTLGLAACDDDNGIEEGLDDPLDEDLDEGLDEDP